MCDSFFKGDLQTALEPLRRVRPQVEEPLSEALRLSVNPIPVKKAMNLMGMNVGPLKMCIRDRYIGGQFRSFNRHEEKKNRLVLSVFARELEVLDSDYDEDCLLYTSRCV